MDKHLSILQVTGTLDPEYGGPPVVVNQLTRSLTALGHKVDVVTLDPPAAAWLEGAPEVVALGPGKGTYGYSRQFRAWLMKSVRNYDAVVAHGIWGYHSLAVRQACLRSTTPYFVFIHGALDPWFKRRYPLKHAKKWIYWRTIEHTTLSKAKAVIYTQVRERDLARQSFRKYKLREAIVRLGIDEPVGDPLAQREQFFSRFPELRGKRIFLFLSRLHPKKGCDLLIEAFARVADVDARLHLVVAGPDESGLEPRFRELSARLGIADRVSWPGMLTGDVKWGAYRAAEIFALISHSENFGVVVAESLACGLPVLTTDKVNIHREIDESGAGLIGTDTAESAAANMALWLSKSDNARQAMQQRARSCYVENFGPQKAATDFLKLLDSTIDSPTGCHDRSDP